MSRVRDVARLVGTRLSSIGLGHMADALDALPDDPDARGRALNRLAKGAWALRRGTRTEGGASTHLGRDLAGFVEQPVLAVACAGFPLADGRTARAGFLAVLVPADAHGRRLCGLLGEARRLGLTVGVPDPFLNHTGGVPGCESVADGMRELLGEKKSANTVDGIPDACGDSLGHGWRLLDEAGMPLLCDLGWLAYAPTEKGMPACLDAMSWTCTFLFDLDAWESRGDARNADRSHGSVLRHLSGIRV